MKPCRKFKERIALSIAEGESDAAVQEHLQQCAACRAYAEEIRAICSEHAQHVSQLPQIDAPLRLRAKLRAALHDEDRRWSWFRPVVAGALAALVIGLYLHWRPSPKENSVVIVAPPRKIKVAEPSYAAYRNHLSRSAEELEMALSRYDAAGSASDEVLKVSSRNGEVQ